MRNSAWPFPGNKEPGSGYAKVSVEHTLSSELKKCSRGQHPVFLLEIRYLYYVSMCFAMRYRRDVADILARRCFVRVVFFSIYCLDLSVKSMLWYRVSQPCHMVAEHPARSFSPHTHTFRDAERRLVTTAPSEKCKPSVGKQA